MLLKLLMLIGAVLALAPAGIACTCGHVSVCDAYREVDAVVVAHVTKYRSASVPMTYVSESGKKQTVEEEGQDVYLSIVKWFKGTGPKYIILSQPNSSCDWTFDEGNLGKQYLFYLVKNRSNGRYQIQSCGRSVPYGQAAADLSWLNGLPNSLKRTYIAGRTNLSDDSGTFPGLTNVSVSITGRKKYHLETNEKGFYNMWDVPPGTYRITATPPENTILGWTVSTPEGWMSFWSLGDSDLKALDITVKPQNCGGVDFMFKPKK